MFYILLHLQGPGQSTGQDMTSWTRDGGRQITAECQT